MRSLGRGRDDKKELLAEGIVEEDVKSRLYVEMLELACKGEVCGELYRATIKRPNENISAAIFRFESNTKSGEQ